MSRSFVLAFLAGVGLAATAMAQDEAPEPWREKFYNPVPTEDDLILPMPCGGRMAFRPIEIQSTGWLDDMKIELGRNDDDLGYKEGRRFTHIAGAFTDRGDSHRRFFYMAKYETSQLQYDAFGDSCPRPRTRSRLPVVNVSWFDAVAYAQRYSEWLLQNARDRLPVEGDTVGYLRLPTEVEWEYAARGGLAVDRAQFVANLFPTPDGELAEYAWYHGSQSAGGELQLTGLLKPNPLGLHDVIGNAAEMVFDTFRLNRRGRLHGQAGGFVSKGGNISSSRDQLRTAARHEHAYFDYRGGRATKLRRLGFRLILTAPVIVSSERLSKIQEEWSLLPVADIVGGAGVQERRAMELLQAVSEEASNEELRSKLEVVLRDLAQANTERNDSRDRAVRALLRMGAFLGNKIRTDHVRLKSVERAIESVALPALEALRQRVEGTPEAETILGEAEAKLEQMRERQSALKNNADTTLSYYGDTVITVASDHSEQVVTPQLEAVKVEFRAKKSDYLIPYAETFVRHLDEYRESGAADTAEWVQEIVR